MQAQAVAGSYKTLRLDFFREATNRFRLDFYVRQYVDIERRPNETYQDNSVTIYHASDQRLLSTSKLGKNGTSLCLNNIDIHRDLKVSFRGLTFNSVTPHRAMTN